LSISLSLRDLDAVGVLNLASLDRNYAHWDEHFAHIHADYAIKCFPHPDIVQRLH
jgi:diaminopimelate decarboxylase